MICTQMLRYLVLASAMLILTNLSIEPRPVKPLQKTITYLRIILASAMLVNAMLVSAKPTSVC